MATNKAKALKKKRAKELDDYIGDTDGNAEAIDKELPDMYDAADEDPNDVYGKHHGKSAQEAYEAGNEALKGGRKVLDADKNKTIETELERKKRRAKALKERGYRAED